MDNLTETYQKMMEAGEGEIESLSKEIQYMLGTIGRLNTVKSLDQKIPELGTGDDFRKGKAAKRFNDDATAIMKKVVSALKPITKLSDKVIDHKDR